MAEDIDSDSDDSDSDEGAIAEDLDDAAYLLMMGAGVNKRGVYNLPLGYAKKEHPTFFVCLPRPPHCLGCACACLPVCVYLF